MLICYVVKKILGKLTGRKGKILKIVVSKFDNFYISSVKHACIMTLQKAWMLYTYTCIIPVFNFNDKVGTVVKMSKTIVEINIYQ